MKKELIHEDISYKVNGILFAVHNKLGRYRNEKQYGDLIEWYLKENGMPYEREKILPASFNQEKQGRNKIDFLIDDKVILEIKAKRFTGKTDYYQVMRYLTSLNKRLAIVVNFHQRYLVPKRIVSGYD